MLGRSHLLVGAGGWLVAAPPLMSALGYPMDKAQVAAGAVVVAGTSMFPDLDTVNSTIARSLGPVTYVIARGVSKISGGHRNGTHSLLCALLMTLIAAWALNEPFGNIVKFALCIFFVSLAVRALTEADGAICFALSALIGATCASVAGGVEWLVAAAGMGCLLHMLGDALTSEGVPLLYPFSRRRFKLPVIQRTGNGVEKIIASACGLAVCWLMATMVFVPIFKETSQIQTQPVSAQERSGTSKACQQLHRRLGRNRQAQGALKKVCGAPEG
jgi:membrane-bound metal-dependent hydrolase YbcI (DUF457 family)